MKKLLHIASILNLVLNFAIFSMEEPEQKRRKFEVFNEENLSDNENELSIEDALKNTTNSIPDKVPSLKIQAAKVYLDALDNYIESIIKFDNLKAILTSALISKSNLILANNKIKEIIKPLNHKYRQILFEIFFNDYIINYDTDTISSVSFNLKRNFILVGENSDEQKDNLSLLCLDLNEILLSGAQNIKASGEICLKDNHNNNLFTTINSNGKLAITANDAGIANFWDLSGLDDLISLNSMQLYNCKNRSLNISLTLETIHEKDLNQLNKDQKFKAKLIAISPDNKYALISQADNQNEEAVNLVLIDLQHSNRLIPIKFEPKANISNINTIEFIPYESYVLVSANNALILLDLNNIDEISDLNSANYKKFEFNSPITCININSDHKYALIGFLDNTVKVLSLEDLKENSAKIISKDLSIFQNKEIISLALSPNQNYALSLSRDGIISLLNIDLNNEEIQIKALNYNDPIRLIEGEDLSGLTSIKFGSADSFVLFLYVNLNGINLTCLGNLKPLSLEQIILVISLYKIKNNFNRAGFEHIANEILEDEDFRKILDTFSPREKVLLEQYFSINI